MAKSSSMNEIPDLMFACLRTCYGIEIATLESLALGADANASVYRAESVDHKVYFLKLRQNSCSQLPQEIMSLLQQTGIREIIPPVKTRGGQPVQQMGRFTLLVYPFIEGQNGFHRPLSRQQWIQLGQTLRQIHEIKVPEAIQKRIRLESFPSKWRNRVRSVYHRLDDKSDDIGTKFKGSLQKHQKEIEELLNRAEQLSEKIRGQSFPFVLCHSDLHAGNLLLEKDATFYLIDWDDPMLAPRERDLMFMGGGVGNVWNHPHEEALFYEGYGAIEVNSDLLAHYRHERILEDIAEFTEQLLHSESHKDRAEMYGHFIAMFVPQGVVDIALQMPMK